MALTKVTGQVIKNTTDVTVGVLTVTNTLAVGGTVSIGGTLTYEDVTNIDSVGLITARNGIVVGSGITLSKDGDIFATGVTTTGSLVSSGAISGTTGTFTVGTNKNAKFYAASHNDETDLGAGLGFSRQSDGAELISGIFGHSNSGLGVAARDHITFLTGGTSNVSDTEERLRIGSGGDVSVGGHSTNYADSPLEVRGTNAGGDVAIRVTNNSTTAGTQAGVIFTTTTSDFTTAGIAYERGGTADALRFYVGQSDAAGGFDNATERLRIDTSGRVMIGDIDTDNATTDADNLVIGAASGDNGMTIVSQSGNYNGTIRFSDGANSGADSYRGTIQYYHGEDYMRFYTNGTERLRITSTGQVNIGAASPTASENGQLNVYITESSGKAQIVHSAGTGGLRLAGTGSGSGSNLIFSNDYNSGTFSDHWTLTHNGGDDSFRFLAGGTGGTERARLTTNGYFLVGGTNTNFGQGNTDTGIGLNPLGRVNSSRDGAASLLLNRNSSNGTIAIFYREGVQKGNINITTSAVAYNTSSSDRTLKKNFEDWTENTLDLFKSLKPQKFNFIHQEDSENKIKGYVAQDLVDSFPEAYPKDDDGKYQFNPSGMVVYLMKAIQELKDEVEQLKSQLNN